MTAAVSAAIECAERLAGRADVDPPRAEWEHHYLAVVLAYARLARTHEQLVRSLAIGGADMPDAVLEEAL